MENIEFMAASYALVGILIFGYIGVQHHRINYLSSLLEEEVFDGEESRDS